MNLIALAMRAFLTLLISATAASGFASPGAHGPNGEHLDGSVNVADGADSSPKMVVKSEQFELVATLGIGELSILVDRFQTNEPVLNARVEVESGKLKADAKFHADHGDYAVDDPALLKALQQPGSHPIVITVIGSQESDLLEGTLNVATAVADSGHGHAHDQTGGHANHTGHGHGAWLRPTFVIAGLVVLGLGGFWWMRRNRRTISTEVSQ